MSDFELNEPLDRRLVRSDIQGRIMDTYLDYGDEDQLVSLLIIIIIRHIFL